MHLQNIPSSIRISRSRNRQKHARPPHGGGPLASHYSRRRLFLEPLEERRLLATTLIFQDGVFPDPSYSGTRDTRLRSDRPTRVFGSSSKLEVDGNPDFTTLLHWDISTIPAGSVVTSAAISVDVVAASNDLFEIYALKRGWVESEATFNEAAAGVSWQSPGAAGTSDRGSTVLGTATSPSTGSATFVLNDDGVNVINSWINDPASNYGFVVQDFTNATTDDLDFRSRENSSANGRPALSLTYEAGGPTPGVKITESSGTTEVSEAGVNDDYTIVLEAPPISDVTVAINADVQLDTDVVSLLFTSADWDQPQTVHVTAVDDGTVEGIHTGSIGHTASSSDPLYDGLGVSGVTAQITDNDFPAGVTIGESNGTTAVSETGATDDYSVVLDKQPTADVTITIIPDGQLTADPPSLFFTPSDWNVAQAVTVGAVDDASVEGSHTGQAVHTVSSSDPQYDGIGVASVIVQIADNDLPAGVTVSESSGATSVSEAGVNDDYTIVLDTQPAADVTVSVGTDGQLETNPTDLLFTSANWNVPQSVTVAAVDDNSDEGSHLSLLTHTAASSDPAYAAISISQVSVQISDNDGASSGSISFQDGVFPDPSYFGTRDTRLRSDQATKVLGGTSKLEVDGNPDFSTILKWDISGIPAGSSVTSASISVDVVNSSTAVFPIYEVHRPWNETEATFNLAAANSAWEVPGAAGPTDRGDTVLGSATSSTTGIVTFDLNDSGLAVVNAWLANPALNYGFILQNYDNAATNDLDFLSRDNSTASSRPKLTLTYATASPAGSVTLVESEGFTSVGEDGTTDVYTIALDTPPASDVTITVTPDGQLDANPASLLFTPTNWHLPQLVTVSATDDSTAEGNHAGSIGHTVNSSDPSYAAIAVGSINAQIADNDAAGVTIAESESVTEVNEHGSTDDYTVVLDTQPASNVTVAIQPDGQLETNFANLLFTTANWNTPQTVTVSAVDDSALEGLHSGTINHSVSSGDPLYSSLSVASVVAQIEDNDGAGVLINETAASTEVGENGTMDDYTVVLNTQPASDVTITISPNSQLTADASSLVFTPSNWNLEQTVTVSAVDDVVAEGDHQGFIHHDSSSSDPAFAGVSIQSVTVQVADNDIAGVTVTEVDGATHVSESGTTDEYTVVLDTEPQSAVTVTINPDGQLGTNVTSLLFTPGNWQLPQTVTVHAVDDDRVEEMHIGIISHGVASSDPFYANIGITSVTADITDNDVAGVTISETGNSTDVSEDGATDQYTVVLDTQPTAEVTVSINTASGLVSDQASLTFTPTNWNVAQTVTVSAVDDAIAEGNHSGSVSHSVTSSDPWYTSTLEVRLQSVATGFSKPLVATHAADGSGRIFVAQHGGTIQIVRNGILEPTPFLDLGASGLDRIVTGGERGLLGLAFHPDFAVNGAIGEGKFYVYYSSLATFGGDHDSVISEFQVSNDPDLADITSERELLRFSQPFSSHNAGDMHFGPDDGLLYISTGDGGSAGDPQNNAQNRANLLGNILRIDVNGTDGPGGEYGIPPSNPFVGQTGVRAEIFAFGFRNPHRFSIDDGAMVGDADRVFVGDVGQSSFEEVDLVTSGGNYGWRIREGAHPFNASDPDPGNLVDPIAEYANDDTTDSVIGGYVYRGTLYPGLRGRYIFGDLTGRMFVLHEIGGSFELSDLNVQGGNPIGQGIIAFGKDQLGELYVLTFSEMLQIEQTANPLAVSSVTVHISDNDSAGVTLTASDVTTEVSEDGATDDYTVTLDTQPAADVTVTISPDGQLTTNLASLLFTPSNWNVAQTVTVAAVDDGATEGIHVGQVSHAAISSDPFYAAIGVDSVTAEITDNEMAGVTITESGTTDVSEDGGLDSYSLVLDSQPTSNVIITIIPDAQLGANFTSLLFTPSNWHVPQTVTIHAVNDNQAEGIHLGLVSHTVDSGDPSYASIGVGSINVQVTDNDVAGVTITESGGTTEVSEDGATDDYSIVLDTEPASQVTVTIGPGDQLNGDVATLLFSPSNWHLPQTVTVTAIDDDQAEGPHSGEISHSSVSSDPFYDGIAVSNTTVQVSDNDLAGVTITETGGTTDIGEDGTSDDYSVVLDTQPAVDVTIVINADSQLATDVGSLLFTATNWNLAQTVTVSAIDDHIAEAGHASVISHSVVSSDAFYASIGVASVSAQISDNDVAGVTISESGGTTAVGEDGTTDNYDVILDSQPVADVAVTITSDDQLSTDATTLHFTASNWDTPQWVNVSAINDNSVEGPHTGLIDHSATSADPMFENLSVASVIAQISDNDSPGVTISESDGTTDLVENGVTDEYSVVLNTEPADDVTVIITPDNQVSVDASSIVFTPENWNVAQTVTVTAVNDLTAEGSHTGQINHNTVSNDPPYHDLAVDSVFGQITDDDFAGITISETSGATGVTESGATDEYTVVLDSPPQADVIVAHSPDGQLLTDAGSFLFTLSNWHVPQTLTITAVNDSIAEGNHSGSVQHSTTSSDPFYNDLAVDVTVQIADDDFAGVTISESDSSTNVSEDGATDAYTVVLDTPPTSDVTVAIHAGPELTSGATSLLFTSSNWSVPQTVTVAAVNDDIAEGTHQGLVMHNTMSADPQYDGLVADVAVQITDDDVAGVVITESLGSSVVEEGGATDDYSVVLETEPLSDVTVTVSPGSQLNTDAATLVFTTSNWQQAQTVTVDATDDFSVEGNHSGTIVHSVASSDSQYDAITVPDITVQITDNDVAGVTVAASSGSTSVAEAGSSDEYSVVLNTVPDADVTIMVSPDSQLGADISILLFTPSDWNVPRTVSVSAIDDAIIEGNHTGMVDHSAASDDPEYAAVSIAAVTAQITDNDAAGVTIMESGGNSNASEQGLTDTYMLVLDAAPASQVTVTIDPDSQLSVDPTSVDFLPSNWHVPQVITVGAVDDAIAEGSHTGQVTHSVSSSGDPLFAGISVDSLTVQVADNDVAGVTVMESGGGTAISEDGTTDDYMVVLDAAPTSDVIVTIQPDSQTVTSVSSLLFTPLNWNVQQAVTVSAVDDSAMEGTHSGVIVHSLSSSDPLYSAVSVASVIAQIADNEFPGVTVSESDSATTVSEDGAMDAYTLVLDTQPASDVVVTVTPDAQLASDVNSLVFTPSNWHVAQSVVVSAIDDATPEGMHIGLVSHTVSSSDANYDGLLVADVSATVLDNEQPTVLINDSDLIIVTEGGGTKVYTVELTHAPTADVTIMVSPDSQLLVSPPNLVFTPANWGPRAVAVEAQDDILLEGSHFGFVNHAV